MNHSTIKNLFEKLHSLLHLPPRPPNSGGRSTRYFGLLPPELGSHFRDRVPRLKESGVGWGGQCNVFNTFQTGSKAYKNKTATRLILVTLLGLSLMPVAAWADEDEAPPSGRSSGGRGCGTTTQTVQSDVPSLILLAPQGSAKTVSNRPTFAWFVRDATPISIEFRLYSQEENNRYKLVKEIKDDRFKTVPGVMMLSLAQATPELAIGRYRWQVALVCDRSHPSSNLFAESELEVVPMPLDLKAQLQKTLDPVSQASLYAQANFWYDALGAAMSTSNNNAGLKDPRLSLLDKVTLSNIERQLVQSSKIYSIQR
jgi:Domain of Unknown Function (DUF928)